LLFILAPIAADAASAPVGCERRLAVAAIDPAGSRSVDLAVSLVALESLDAASAQGFWRDNRHLPNEFQKVGLGLLRQIDKNLRQIEEARRIALPRRLKRANVFARPPFRWTGTACICRTSEADVSSINTVVAVDPGRPLAAVSETLRHQRTVGVLRGSVDLLDRLLSLGHGLGNCSSFLVSPTFALSRAAPHRTAPHRTAPEQDSTGTRRRLQTQLGRRLHFVIIEPE
jgi:hypothetical protein